MYKDIKNEITAILSVTISNNNYEIRLYIWPDLINNQALIDGMFISENDKNYKLTDVVNHQFSKYNAFSLVMIKNHQSTITAIQI